MDPSRVRRYLERLGVERGAPTLGLLGELQERHLHVVPFENLSVHLREPIVLEPAALVDKIVERRRGGFCYELNGAFGALLTALGYEVTHLAARVKTGPLFDHLALRVDLDGGPWLVDVGFGRFTHRPIRLDVRTPQSDPGGTFTVTADASGDLAVDRDGEPEYTMETRPRTLADFEPTCWWQCTSPKSHFTQSLVCTRLTGSGRVTLSGRTLIRTRPDGRDERTLGGDAEVLAAYHEHFGIVLDTVPEVRAPWGT
ncbi:arylamine N-acetyltransferase [Virgisporangium ochraceum]|uniref:N-hydroxyarylamine O-acetyltransferase n=1 Tax=Virgisporangium ochraceum TaxID=65505 RepID=A0A8J3ZU81_9ACTN|nr:arylamine N-acetyltransferase [Virgisporangium ochraceum]GIJ69082.1 N-hydroxyarylamine O-acetyltransferase [Virgisporangium ochraceum]